MADLELPRVIGEVPYDRDLLNPERSSDIARKETNDVIERRSAGLLEVSPGAFINEVQVGLNALHERPELRDILVAELVRLARQTAAHPLLFRSLRPRQLFPELRQVARSRIERHVTSEIAGDDRAIAPSERIHLGLE